MNNNQHQPAIDASDGKTKPALWKRLLRIALIFIGVPYLAILLLFVVMQRQLMYAPTKAESLKVADVGLDANLVRDLQLTTPDGEILNGWLWQTAKREGDRERAPLVVYFAGNALNRQQRADDVREFASAGYDVLIFDYRGYGDSSGSPSEKAMSADAQLIWNYAINDLGYPENRTVLFGESLGGAVALSLWGEDSHVSPRPAAVMLNSTFTSMGDAASWHYPIFPFRYCLLDPWPSMDRIGNVDVPMVLFHGTEDTIVPVEHGRRLAARAKYAQFFEIPGVGHNYVPTYRLREQLVTIREGME